MEPEIEVRTMIPADAAGFVACIQRCYGDAYPNRLMYQPEVLAEQLLARSYRGVVATNGGDIVGHIGYNLPDPAAIIVEAGTTVVDPRHRGAGLMTHLAAALRENSVADDAVGFIHYPTTAHTVMQKASLRSGGCETGIMMTYLPPAARDLTIGGSGEDRLAVTVVYQPLVDGPERTIFLPDRYHDLIVGFADQLKLRRTFADASTQPTATTEIRPTAKMDGRLVRLTVGHIGADFASAIAAATAGSDADLIHVDLAMDAPETSHAVETLRAAGFVFSAWLPGWSGSDVLRLQLLSNPTASELRPTLYSPAAHDIADLIRREWEAPRAKMHTTQESAA